MAGVEDVSDMDVTEANAEAAAAAAAAFVTIWNIMMLALLR